MRVKHSEISRNGITNTAMLIDGGMVMDGVVGGRGVGGGGG